MLKKKWKKPQLIVLVRGKRDEHVLVTCKMMAVLPGPSNSITQCVPLGCDDPCYDQVAS